MLPGSSWSAQKCPTGQRRAPSRARPGERRRDLWVAEPRLSMAIHQFEMTEFFSSRRAARRGQLASSSRFDWARSSRESSLPRLGVIWSLRGRCRMHRLMARVFPPNRHPAASRTHPRPGLPTGQPSEPSLQASPAGPRIRISLRLGSSAARWDERQTVDEP